MRILFFISLHLSIDRDFEIVPNEQIIVKWIPSNFVRSLAYCRSLRWKKMRSHYSDGSRKWLLTDSKTKFTLFFIEFDWKWRAFWAITTNSFLMFCVDSLKFAFFSRFYRSVLIQIIRAGAYLNKWIYSICTTKSIKIQ